MAYFAPTRLYVSYLCVMLYYAYNIVCLAIPFSFVTFSIHRLCFIIYHTKPFFKTKQWTVTCIAGQWISQCIISLPFIFPFDPYCPFPVWIRIYTCFLIIFLSVFLNTALNVRIFMYVRASGRRIQAETNVDRNHSVTISRREIALLKQMIFLFFIFIVGWGPDFIIICFDELLFTGHIIFQLARILCEISALCITIDLYRNDHKLKEYIMNKIRLCQCVFL